MLVGIMFLPGCGGGNSGGGGKTGVRTIRIYQSGGATTYMNTQQKGIVFADGSMVEIQDAYATIVSNKITGEMSRYVSAYLFDENGNKIDSPVTFAKDLSGDNEDCYLIKDLADIPGGGTGFFLSGNVFGGKGKLIASCQGVTKEIEIHIFDGMPSFMVTVGIKMLPTGSSQCTIRSESAFFFDTIYSHRIVGRSYVAAVWDDGSWSDWGVKLMQIKTVDVSRIQTGSVDNPLDNTCKVYVGEVPTGGYFKITRFQGGQYFGWEFTDKVNEDGVPVFK